MHKCHWRRPEDGRSPSIVGGEKSPHSAFPHHITTSHLTGDGARPTPAVPSPAASAEVAVDDNP